MIDIITLANNQDMGVLDTQTPRAANILTIQLGNLEYAPDLGIDLRYFLSEDFRFQNESFKSYLVEILANKGINVASVSDLVENLHRKFTINISKEDLNSGLVG